MSAEIVTFGFKTELYTVLCANCHQPFYAGHICPVLRISKSPLMKG